jgi:hypothetical protein
MLISISGNATLVYSRNLNVTPWRSASPATVRLALAPINVPFPPKHAPSAKARHKSVAD